MARYGKEQERYHTSKVRSLLTIDPQMSLREIQNQLAENNLPLHLNYIQRLTNKIRAERTKRIDTITLNRTLATFMDVLNETTRIAWQVAISGTSTKTEKIAALREIRAAHRDAFDKLFDAGVFNRKLGELENTLSVNVVLSNPKVVQIFKQAEEELRKVYVEKLEQAKPALPAKQTQPNDEKPKRAATKGAESKAGKNQ